MSLRRTGDRSNSVTGTDTATGLAVSTAPFPLTVETGPFICLDLDAQLVQIVVAGLEMLEARGKLGDIEDGTH